MQSAKLYVEPKSEGRVLLTVGGNGVGQSINYADLITICFRRERARNPLAGLTG